MRRDRIAVDSDALLDREGSGAFAKVEAAIRRGILAIPSVVVFEVLRVARGDRDRLQRAIRGARVYPLDAHAARRAAELYLELEDRGTRIGERDTLIAATCLTFRLPLLTRNVKHFGRVEGLTLIAG